MSQPALELTEVWKKFKKGENFDSLRDLIPSLTRRLVSRPPPTELERREFWAVQGLNLRVERGEAVGIIGSNGAGKSTTLKLLSRVLRPTLGHIVARGRLSALIEVGAGFHPDLTGRENVYLNGAILGMKRAEVAQKFDQIVAFAGMAEFIDTPVKRYSSGMYARLGFAVAAHVEPEILVVDEVLSVGDMPFQEKCLNRMRQVLRDGTTVIFVSHNLQAVQSLCSRALLLQRGQVLQAGACRDVIAAYVRAARAGAAGADRLLGEFRLTDEFGRVRDSFRPGERARLHFSLDAAVPVEDCIAAFLVQRLADGQDLCDYNFPLSSPRGVDATPPGRAGFAIDFNVNLLRGAYGAVLKLYHVPTSTFLEPRADAGIFTVSETASYGGIAHLNPSLSAGFHTTAAGRDWNSGAGARRDAR